MQAKQPNPSKSIKPYSQITSSYNKNYKPTRLVSSTVNVVISKSTSNKHTQKTISTQPVVASSRKSRGIENTAPNQRLVTSASNVKTKSKVFKKESVIKSILTKHPFSGISANRHLLPGPVICDWLQLYKTECGVKYELEQIYHQISSRFQSIRLQGLEQLDKSLEKWLDLYGAGKACELLEKVDADPLNRQVSVFGQLFFIYFEQPTGHLSHEELKLAIHTIQGFLLIRPQLRVSLGHTPTHFETMIRWYKNKKCDPLDLFNLIRIILYETYEAQHSFTSINGLRWIGKYLNNLEHPLEARQSCMELLFIFLQPLKGLDLPNKQKLVEQACMKYYNTNGPPNEDYRPDTIAACLVQHLFFCIDNVDAFTRLLAYMA